ncbi:hypothetical protein OJ997_09000 [Solirubrobacter phytolaccae]|uniref:Uncharacterized protein n=1 Tax=Solirubrobacter phytolaccae TaxID=1404360 RepID=A0A9X3N670_9ACTN|nr:hypothetical protein [Solirubrobacter phytolaccae]MDA0180428.1 hypothetical protein [Solirubrobacter phytolaccae]
MNLDTFMDDFGRDLTRAAKTRSRRRRRLALRLTPVIPVGAALALALTLLPGGGGSVDAIAAARAALAPDGEIVHMKVQMGFGRGGSLPPVEQWYAADPKRWRTRTEALAVPGKGRLRPTQFETAFSNDRVRFYDQRRDVVTIWRADQHPRTFGPGLLGGDPATDLREQLGKGGVRDDGVVTVDGKRVRRLVQDSERQRFVYYMDPDTFAPVSGHISLKRPDGKRFRGPQFTVVLYERLPLNEQTEQLLKFDKTPETRYVWR